MDTQSSFQMYFILKSPCNSSPRGSLHRSRDSIKTPLSGLATLRTTDLDQNTLQDIVFEELIHLPGDHAYHLLLPVQIHGRLSLFQHSDYSKLISLRVGDNVYFHGECAAIKAIGPTKLSSKGWFLLLEFPNKIGSSVPVSIDAISLYPPIASNNGFYGTMGILSCPYESQKKTVEKRNYKNNSHFSHHQSDVKQPFCFNNHCLDPSSAELKISNSIQPWEKDSRSQQKDNSLWSKSEIDDQISHVNGGGIIDGGRNDFPFKDPYHSHYTRETPHPFISKPDMTREVIHTYPSAMKEDNHQRQQRRRIARSQIQSDTFSSVLNIRDNEEDESSSTAKELKAVRTRVPVDSSINANTERRSSSRITGRDLNKKGEVANSTSQLESELQDSSTLDSIKALNCEFDTICHKPRTKAWEIGSLVEVHIQGKPLYGVGKWIGRIPRSNLEYMGIELEERFEGAGNGFLNEKKIFDCPKRHGIFLLLTKIQKDQRFINSEEEEQESQNMNIYENDLPCCRTEDSSSSFGDFGFPECPSIPGRIPPMGLIDFDSLIGRNKGIQGFHNSCYLDSTIFAMFSFSSVFDFLLYRPPDHKDIKEYSELQKVLREDIVNPLRRNFFVRSDKIMKLRKFLGCLSDVEGLTTEEKDPEEFLNSLLCQTLKATPFLQLSSGQTSHFYQLFVERDEFRQTSPTVQELFEQSFFTSDVKLKSVPSVLILQMPRFGRQFKVYDRIRPTQTLDITDIIEGAPRQCIICGNLATLECHSCFGVHGQGLDSTSFCRKCSDRTHSHKNRQHHSLRDLILPQGLPHIEKVTSRLYMKLFAVLCIETSHYVTFSKCGDGPKAPWCLFDSMADRKGEANGYNIPEVSRAYDLEDYFRQPENSEEPRTLTPHVKRLLCDGYMYFYQSEEVMMYQ